MEVTVKIDSKVIRKLIAVMEERSLDFNAALRICVLGTHVVKNYDVLIETQKELAETKDALEGIYNLFINAETRITELEKELTEGKKAHACDLEEARQRVDSLRERIRKMENELISIEAENLLEIKRDHALQKELKVSRQDTKIQCGEIKNLRGKLTHMYEIKDALQEELRVADQLIETRNTLLEMIPECALHGKHCVPHAQKWIINQLNGFC